jgi:hypothetical protein
MDYKINENNPTSISSSKSKYLQLRINRSIPTAGVVTGKGMYEQVLDEICTSSTAWVDAAIALRPHPDVVGEAPTDNPDDVSRSPRLSPICFYCFGKLQTVEEMRKENTKYIFLTIENTKLLRKRKRNSLKGLKTQHTRTPRQPNNHTRSVQRLKQKKKHRS